jgi:hypothetical protein
MNPMSDIPVTAAWTLSVVAAAAGWPVGAGLSAGMALLIRPNLAAVALVIAAWIGLTRKGAGRFALALVPFVAAVGVVNASIYESAWTSGYGTLDDLYALSFAGPNVAQFARWTLETQTPVVLLAALFFAVPGWLPPSRIPRPRLLLGGVMAAVFVSYLFYKPFDAWWYLRFLLPMWPILMTLVVAAIFGVATRVARLPVSAATLGVAMVLAALGVRIAIARDAFDVGRGERRYLDVARFVAGHTEPSSVMIALQHSGTLRMYAGRMTLRFDQLDPAWLDRAIAFLQSSGRHPYIVVEDGERGLFVQRFGAAADAGRLSWPPFAELESGRVAIYDPIERQAGTPLAIAAAASRRTGWRCDPPYERAEPAAAR